MPVSKKAAKARVPREALTYGHSEAALTMRSEVSQAFFPRAGAWENLKKALDGDYEESVWYHLADTIGAPFNAGEQAPVAVEVNDQGERIAGS